MEIVQFQYRASKAVRHRVHVGVVGSGDLEILIEPTEEEMANITIRTKIVGFSETWKVLMDRFMRKHNIRAAIEINDFGATPGVVSLRLAQAIEVLGI